MTPKGAKQQLPILINRSFIASRSEYGFGWLGLSGVSIDGRFGQGFVSASLFLIDDFRPS
jgi:hypothetical protein